MFKVKKRLFTKQSEKELRKKGILEGKREEVTLPEEVPPLLPKKVRKAKPEEASQPNPKKMKKQQQEEAPPQARTPAEQPYEEPQMEDEGPEAEEQVMHDSEVEGSQRSMEEEDSV